MTVTTRNYSIAEQTPVNIINGLHDAITDLGWFEPQPYGYLISFTATPGSTKRDQVNKRYLVSPTSTGVGANAVVDVLRSGIGSIAAITLVTGGEGYHQLAKTIVSSTGNTINVGNTSGIYVGQIVNKTGGTGTLLANTVVTSIMNSSYIMVDRPPSVALSSANLYFTDILTISSNTIGGNNYNIFVSGAGSTTTLNANTPAEINDTVLIGQRVYGSNILPLTVVTAVTNTSITISQATYGTVAGNVTFSDDISLLVTGVVNANNLIGTAAGQTITGVVTNTNLNVGGEVTILDSTGPQYMANSGRVIIASVAGTGPYTITLRNDENTFKGFSSNGAINFKVSSGNQINWFTLDRYTAPSTTAWAVGKIKNSDDRLGCTFWLFNVTLSGNQPLLSVKPMTGFNPVTISAQGVSNFDWYSNALATNVTGAPLTMIMGSMLNQPMTLRTRQSGTDSNFATFSFFDGNNNRSPFFISKYNSGSQPWSLNDVFLGGAYEVFQSPTYATNDAYISMRIRMTSVPKRQAEAGYGPYGLSATAAYFLPVFRATSGSRAQAAPVAMTTDLSVYLRQDFDIQNGINDGIKIYKNIPINPLWYPISYYLPDDFGIVEIPWKFAAVGDTITIGAETWAIVQAGVNQTTQTAICLVARTV